MGAIHKTANTYTDPSLVFTTGATGDLYYKNASNILVALTKGTQNYLLRAGASIPEYAAPKDIIVLGSDADGDIYYRNGGELVRLAKGTNGHYLTLSGGLPAWAAVAGGLESGTVAFFKQAAAPTDWTIDNTGLTDAVGNERMMCAVHSNQYDADGGSQDPTSMATPAQGLDTNEQQDNKAGDSGIAIPDGGTALDRISGAGASTYFTKKYTVNSVTLTPYYTHSIVCAKD